MTIRRLSTRRISEIDHVERRSLSAESIACWCIAAWGVAAALVMLFANVLFLVNDDQVMESIASGRYTGRPVHHLVFIGFLPGVVLQRLYLLTDRVPWYTLMLMMLNALALGLLTAVIVRRRRSLGPGLTTLALVALGAFGSFFLVRPTFTVTSMLLTMAAVAVASTITGTAGRRQRARIAVLCALIATATTIRFDGVLGIVLTVLPTVALVLATRRRRTAIVLVLSSAVSIAAMRVLDILTRDIGGWGPFNEFNQVRGQLHGNVLFADFMKATDSPLYRQLLRANRWTSDNVAFFERWLYDDPVTYSLGKVKNLLAAVQQMPNHVQRHDLWHSVFYFRTMALLAAGVMVVALITRGWRTGLFGLVSITFSVGTAVWLATTSRFPIRVGFPVMLATLVLPLCVVPLLRVAHRSTVGRAITTSVALVAAMLTCVWWQQYANPVVISNTIGPALAATREDQRSLVAIDPDGIFVRVGPFATEATDTSATLEPNVLPLGWMIFSPVQHARVAKLGVDQRLLPSLVDQPHRYLVTSSSLTDEIRRMYRRSLHIEVRLEKQLVLNELTTVYQVVRVAPVVRRGPGQKPRPRMQQIRGAPAHP